MESKIIIAIDGHSSCGKSTLAKALAKALHYIYVDSGAMYRAVTLYFIEQGVDWQDAGQVDAALADIDISFRRSEAGVPLWKRLAYVAITRAETRLHWVTRYRLGRPQGPLSVDDLRRGPAPLALQAEE